MRLPNRSNLVFFGILIFTLFFLSGGPNTLNIYLNHLSVSVRTARSVLTAPFFTGFLLFGFMGLRYAWKNAKDKGKVALGFVYTVFSYFGLEVLFWAVNK